MNKTWKAVLGIMLIFLLGWLSGALCVSLFMGHRALALLQRGPDGMAEILERRTTRNLDLDPNQKKQIHEYIMENLAQRKKLQAEIQPQVQTLNRQTIKEINAILRPDQQEQFHGNPARLKQRFGKNPLHPAAEESAGPATNSGAGQPPADH